mmetsp:Transcript_2000/g.6027  ORF Transcript_2000/g.6027 Transcript_2000/m.6027 type:complete len:269 (-) Transcript_2000:19-825(-)
MRAEKGLVGPDGRRGEPPRRQGAGAARAAGRDSRRSTVHRRLERHAPREVVRRFSAGDVREDRGPRVALYDGHQDGPRQDDARLHGPVLRPPPPQGRRGEAHQELDLRARARQARRFCYFLVHRRQGLHREQENPGPAELDRLDRFRDGPWRDMAKLRVDDSEDFLYAEIHGFFAVDDSDGKCFAVVQWLEPGERATVGGFPFDSWKREVAEAGTSSRRCRFEFQVVSVECITLVAFVIPNPDKADHFWVVPPVLKWLQFSAPAAFPS